jgi:hypothetical protein
MLVFAARTLVDQGNPEIASRHTRGRFRLRHIGNKVDAFLASTRELPFQDIEKSMRPRGTQIEEALPVKVPRKRLGYGPHAGPRLCTHGISAFRFDANRRDVAKRYREAAKAGASWP